MKNLGFICRWVPVLAVGDGLAAGAQADGDALATAEADGDALAAAEADALAAAEAEADGDALAAAEADGDALATAEADGHVLAAADGDAPPRHRRWRSRSAGWCCRSRRSPRRCRQASA